MSNEISTNREEQLPTYLQDAERMEDQKLGTEELTNYIRPNRLRIVQKQSDEAMTEKYGVGTVVSLPTGLEIAKKEVPFAVVPIFFFPDWKVWNPRGTDLPMIRELTNNPNDPLVEKCNDSNFRNSQPCPEAPDKYLRYQEHLNFICVLPDVHDSMLFSFSFARTQHRKGSAWAGLIRMRQQAIFAGCYAVRTVKEENNEGTWYGWEIDNQGWVEDSARYEIYKELHMQLAQQSEHIVTFDENEDDILEGQVVKDTETPSF